ncbi:TMAO reductase system periplasmic protein TorT [Vibrio amylolyticus]
MYGYGDIIRYQRIRLLFWALSLCFGASFYVSAQEIERPLSICAVYPHLKDSYWLSVNYGMVIEAQQLGVNLKVFESGGYPNHEKQKQQLKACVDWGANAIILGTVAPNLYHDDLNEYTSNTPIFSTVNHLSLNKKNQQYLKGEVGVDWYWMGYYTGQYLAHKYSNKTEPVDIALLPGPESSGGTKPSVNGFYDAIKNTQIRVIETLWADNDKELQRNLVQQLITENDIDYIVGSAVATEAAITEIRTSQKQEEIKLVSMYLSHGVYRGIVRGRVEFAPTDQMVKQGQLSIRQAYSFLVNRHYELVLSPKIQTFSLDSTNMAKEKSDISASLSPSGYRPTFSVGTIDSLENINNDRDNN